MNPLPTSRKTLQTYWRYTMTYKRDFLIGSIGAILASMTQSIIPPFIIAKLFAKLQLAYAHHGKLQIHEFAPFLIAYALAMLVGAIFWRIQSYFVWQYEIKIRRDIANDVYGHLQLQSQHFHADHFAGALVSQTNKFIGSYERLMDDFIWNILPGLTTLVLGIAVLFFISTGYALVLLFVAVVYILIMWRRVKIQLPYNISEAVKESQQTAALADAVTNLSTIRAFAREKHEATLFSSKVNELYACQRKLSIEVLKTEAISHVQTNTFQVIAVLAGLLAITNFHANVSVLYLVISYTQNIVNQLWQFSRIVRNVNRSLGDAAEMTQILGIEPEIQDAKRVKKFISGQGQIDFKQVHFYYPENTVAPLFEDLTFSVKPGEKIGLVGPSGGGKTTVTKLLLRFIDIQGGEILVDKQNIATVSQFDLRDHISYVAQEPVLFHRSIADNIRYGHLSATDKEVQTVAKMAHADTFISQLPKGYQTFVGERGVKLSDGQRQRVAIARAMLKNAPIIVLDEATSSLDSENEALIQDALWQLMADRTAIVIAHRLSTIQKMDRIIVLLDGKIVEEGSHTQLLAKNGTYATLWAHQSGGFIDE